MNEHINIDTSIEDARKAWQDAKQHADSLNEAARVAERAATRLWYRYIELSNPSAAEIIRHALDRAGYL